MKKGYCKICAIKDEFILQDIESRIDYMSLRKLHKYIKEYYDLDISYQTFRRHKLYCLQKEKKREEENTDREYNPYYVKVSSPFRNREERDYYELTGKRLRY